MKSFSGYSLAVGDFNNDGQDGKHIMPLLLHNDELI